MQQQLPGTGSLLLPQMQAGTALEATSSLPTLSSPRRSSFSRDEMNLAEFPLAALSTRVDPCVKTLEFRDTTKLPNGEIIERKWIITGADKFGLPTSTDDDVVLGLIRLTMDQDFRDRKVYFTRYELLKTLRWSTEGRSYTRLIKSLDRLSGVRLRSTNSFYDNSTKAYQTCNFGIIDAYEINNELANKHAAQGESPKSFFIWSEVLFDSFKAGFIKKLDLDLYFSLKSAVSRRLYRYLDKHFYYRSVIELPLLTLAFEKIGLSRSYKYVSSIKQQVEPAAKELVETGFLAGFEFKGRGEEASVRFISAKTTAAALPAGSQAAAYRSSASPVAAAGSGGDLVGELVLRGVSEMQSRKLLHGRPAAECDKIKAILRYYDHLVQTNDKRISKNKVGFLYRAVEAPYKFSIPSGFAAEAANNNNAVRPSRRPELKVFKASRPITKSSQNHTLRQDPPANTGLSELEREYRKFQAQEIARALIQMKDDEKKNLYAAAQQKVWCLRSVLDEGRFKQAVESCFHEEVRRHWGIIDFNSWCEQDAKCGRAKSISS
jgi:plasmid replication initiation protein